jgi:molybdopterin molybdotransferase
MNQSANLAESTNRQSLSAGQARHKILDALTPVTGWESVAIRAALGRTLARDVVAPYNVPAHDNSAMDGYAIRAEDTAGQDECRLRVVGTAFAGKPFSGEIGAGQAVRIMTGAVMPRGADTVVPQERTRGEDAAVFVKGDQRRGSNVRFAGEDLAEGAAALAAGQRIGPAELGLIASLGIAEVTVYRRLRAAFFSTGDEIASIGKPLLPGQIYDSNRYTLYGALSLLGCDLIDMGVIPDRPEALEAAFKEAASAADVILTSGGVSVGEADFIKELVSRLGEVAFWKIDIKPGRPMAFGKVGDAWLFGLPGNPVAVMVTFYQFVRDALLRLMGVTPLPERPLLQVPCADAIRKMPGRQEFVRGRLVQRDGGWAVAVAGAQGSGILRSMSEADCFIVLDEPRGDVAPGDTVAIELFEGLI